MGCWSLTISPTVTSDRKTMSSRLFSHSYVGFRRFTNQRHISSNLSYWRHYYSIKVTQLDCYRYLSTVYTDKTKHVLTDQGPGLLCTAIPLWGRPRSVQRHGPPDLLSAEEARVPGLAYLRI